MSEYVVTVRWERAGQRFIDNKYRRAHRWIFDGGVEVPGSSSPSVVPLPYSEPRAVDPEEFCVDRYVDEAQGIMARNPAGKMAMTRVTLRPQVVFVGDRLPTDDEITAMHHEAHDECFIANSVTTDVRCEPVQPRAAH